MVDLKWSTEDTGKILANKIISYFTTTYPQDKEIQNLKKWYPHSQAQVFDLVFNGKLRWGTQHLDPFRPIHILSAGRPRWAAQLCKMAANDAYKKNNDKISIGHIDFIMFDYGKFRLSDLYKEHGHQCSQLKHIIESFRNGNKKYKTSELLNFIATHIMKTVPNEIIIENVVIKSPLDIAHFLYRTGFITLNDTTFNNGVSFIRFEDIPDLLIPSNVNEDDIWVIHPSYRKVLNLR